MLYLELPFPSTLDTHGSCPKLQRIRSEHAVYDITKSYERRKGLACETMNTSVCLVRAITSHAITGSKWKIRASLPCQGQFSQAPGLFTPLLATPTLKNGMWLTLPLFIISES